MFELFKNLSLNDARKALLSQHRFSPAEQDWLKNVQTRVHPKERSYLEFSAEHYLLVGLSAVNCIQQAIEKANGTSPRSILDFPSGYGRVLRFIKVAFPEAGIGCMEIAPPAVRFCRKVFGADSSLSQKDFSRLHLKKHYDLIWCGSLVTHLDESNTRDLMAFFYRSLNPGGLCVFTSHGETVEEFLASGQHSYSLNPLQINSILAQYQREGYGYSEYEPSRNGYGISLTSDAKIRQMARSAGNWECTLFSPKGWDNHQDVYAFLKKD